MSTYLVAFVIGELTRVSSSVAGRGGTEVNVWSVPELAPNLGEHRTFLCIIVVISLCFCFPCVLFVAIIGASSVWYLKRDSCRGLIDRRGCKRCGGIASILQPSNGRGFCFAEGRSRCSAWQGWYVVHD
eukprot:COSAG02_NODE_6923_length_3286_cov_1.441481_4_plen_129_part_00